MYYTRENHKRFLDKELTAISESYLKLLNTKAISLLASNDLNVSQYVKLDFKNNTKLKKVNKDILKMPQKDKKCF